MMQLPAGSFDANFHMFFASHYAHHWFNPWNEKWFGGFSQTTYPPLTHQWIALLSTVAGLKMGYMLVQLIAVLLLPVGVFRFARIWVDDRAASYAALGSVFLGALAFLVYQAGQLATVASAALYLNALPYFYEWMTEARGRSLIKGVAISLTAAAAHHVTLIFGVVLFAGPVLWTALLDAKDERVSGSVGGCFRAPLSLELWLASAWALCSCLTGWPLFNIRSTRFRFRTTAARTSCSIPRPRSTTS